MSLIQQPIMRDFVNKLFGFIEYRYFWRARLTCKMWHQQSLLVQRQWLQWLHIHGKHRRISPIRLEPIILKTVALSHQVLQQAMRKQQKRQTAELNANLVSISKAEWTISACKNRVRRATDELALLQKIALKYPQRRKRTRIEINISNNE